MFGFWEFLLVGAVVGYIALPYLRKKVEARQLGTTKKRPPYKAPNATEVDYEEE
ncbi:MAG: hypothetical protein AAF696_20695 [Bacteroidota bacterium]